MIHIIWSLVLCTFFADVALTKNKSTAWFWRNEAPSRFLYLSWNNIKFRDLRLWFHRRLNQFAALSDGNWGLVRNFISKYLINLPFSINCCRSSLSCLRPRLNCSRIRTKWPRVRRTFSKPRVSTSRWDFIA